MTDLTSVGYIHPGHVAACFNASLVDLMFYDAAHHQRIVGHTHGLIGRETGAGQIHQGRNRVVEAILESQAEWLFMVDADMGFPADVVDRLIDAADPVERPIVGGLAFAMKSDGVGLMFARRYRAQPTLYRMAETDDEVGFTPVFNYPRDQLVEVDATGSAIVLIHRGVLEKMHAERPGHWYQPIELPKGKERGFTEFGEDLSFCLRAKALGFPIHVHTGVKTTHDKGGVFLDEDTYDLQQALRAVGS